VNECKPLYTGDRFYIVETGNVAIHRRGKDGRGDRDEFLAQIPQGGYFGELALLRGDTRAATATVGAGASCSPRHACFIICL
jgi:cGMP-dependent protein kinase